MTMISSSIRLACVAALVGLTACGDDTAVASAAVSTASCHAQCDAQAGLEGDCTPFVDHATCKQLCKALADSLPSTCSDEFDAYYECSAADGFVCQLGLVSQKTSACNDEQDALDACDDDGSAGAGASKPKCVGASESGTCPQVACPCPGGVEMVSGFSNAASGCRCWDETSCVAEWCE
jgi:hypothetical protein